MSYSHSVLGYSAALLSGFAWALGSILFRNLGEKITPLGLALGKSLIGVVYLGAVMLVVGLEPVDPASLVMLSVSGVIGIAIGDTLFFRALNTLGPRLTVMIGTLGPVVTVAMAVILLGERPSLLSWSGICMVIAGVTWVVLESLPEDGSAVDKRRGVKYALLATVCMSSGIIFAKLGLTEGSPLQAAFIRLAAGIAGLTILGIFRGSLGAWLKPFTEPGVLKSAFFSVFVVIFGGFWLFLVSLKYVDASIAGVLNSTEPLFVLPLVSLFLREKISIRSIVGSVVAVAGVVLIFLA
ncbi:MAG: DMT family transporter [Candidatus Omnitrophica bacterium]|nr:DMT family transporter [Candidatus Omnitrophota bacterium]